MKAKLEDLNNPLVQIDEEDLLQISGGLTQEEIDKLKEQLKEQTKEQTLNDRFNPPTTPAFDLPKMEQGIEPAEKEKAAPKMDSGFLIPPEAYKVFNGSGLN